MSPEPEGSAQAQSSPNGVNNQRLHFEPSAYLQRLIGRELVADRFVALAEFVKNSFDANATIVTIKLWRGDPQQAPKLTITDNGSGMTLVEFERFWMRPGYSEKDSTRPAEGNRPFLGEKGIGRFAADKLASRLTVVTKKVSEVDALRVSFDWNEFENRSRKMSEVEIPFTRVTQHSFERSRGGTHLELEGLREEWGLADWRRLRRELQNLVTPFRPARRFKIIAECIGGTKAWESGEIKSPVEAQEGYKYTFELTKGGRLRPAIVYPAKIHKKVAEQEGQTLPEPVPTSGAVPDFGPIRGSFYYVEKPSALKGDDFEPGVGIYRDGFRVEPYGREGDDWLGVKATKAARQGHAPITPNRLFGYIEISRYDNPELRDRANREGLLDTPEFKQFVQFVQRRFQEFSVLIGKVEEEVDLELAPTIVAQRETEARPLVAQGRSQAFQEITAQMAHQLRQPLHVILQDSGNLREHLEQRELLDDFTQSALERIEQATERLEGNIKDLLRQTEGVHQDAVEIDLNGFVANLCHNHEGDAQGDGVRLEVRLLQEVTRVSFGEISLRYILTNFVTNALRAAAPKASGTPSVEARVIVEVHKTSDDKVRVTVTDNGPGIQPEVKRNLFVKSVDASMAIGQGQGLFWSQVRAATFKAKLDFEDATPHGAAFFIEFD